jgi:hypothetical protein
MFSLVSGRELHRPAEQSFGVAQALFGLGDGCAKIFAPRWNS